MKEDKTPLEQDKNYSFIKNMTSWSIAFFYTIIIVSSIFNTTFTFLLLYKAGFIQLALVQYQMLKAISILMGIAGTFFIIKLWIRNSYIQKLKQEKQRKELIKEIMNGRRKY